MLLRRHVDHDAVFIIPATPRWPCLRCKPLRTIPLSSRRNENGILCGVKCERDYDLVCWSTAKPSFEVIVGQSATLCGNQPFHLHPSVVKMLVRLPVAQAPALLVSPPMRQVIS